MAKFTTQQYIRKLNKDISNIQKINRPLALAASTGHDLYVQRIFADNITSTGAEIQITRSTKTPRRGTYSRGYARLRQKNGRQIGRVDLVFEGLLRTNITASLQKLGKGWVTGTTRAIESRKVEHLIELYGEDVFKLSKATQDKIVEVMQFEYFKEFS